MDWHLIGLGVQTLIFLAGVYAMVLRADFTGKGVKEELHEMKKELHELKAVVITQAIQSVEIANVKVQLTMLQRTIEDLRRGDGWIERNKRGGLEGEYGP